MLCSPLEPRAITTSPSATRPGPSTASDSTAPTAIGAPAPTICSEPDEHLFWDVVHPSAAAHVILADEMYRQVRTAFVPEPPLPALLLAGASFLGVFRRPRPARCAFATTR